jgi:hypothetical protein
MVQISDSAYSTLNTYAVLAASGITTVNPTTISNGYYGTPGGTGITGSYPPPSTSDNTANATTAQTQLTALVGAINTARTPLTSTPLATYSSGTLTLLPNINYNGTGISFTGTTIVLDGQNLANPQFFITSTSSIGFTNVPSITMINGANNCNVFWMAGTAITFTGTSPTSIPGIFIAGSQITFANASNVLGRLYAQTANITFSGLSSNVNANCTNYSGGGGGDVPISNICFPGDTPITVDQGIIAIKDIDPKIHTIKDEKITAITKTIIQDNFVICFEKDSISENVPSEKTTMSRLHKVSYRGRMIEAQKFAEHFENVHRVEYNGEILYNILMEKHSEVMINNLCCETLEPTNLIAKLYSKFNDQEKTVLIANMNDSILKSNKTKLMNTIQTINYIHKMRKNENQIHKNIIYNIRHKI